MVTAEFIHTDHKQKFATATHGLGDLAFVSADIRASIINTMVVEMLKRRNTLEHLSIANEAARLRNELRSFSAYVGNPNNYPNDAREKVQLALKEADSGISGIDLNTRLSKFSGIHVVADYDGTVTDLTKPFNTSGFVDVNLNDYRTAFIPGSAVAEPLLDKDGREKFAEVFASIWQPLLRDPRGYESFRLAGRSVPLREGVSEFFGYAKERDIKVTVASANFEPFVMGGLDKVRQADGVGVFTVTPESIIATAKGDLLFHLAQLHPDKATIFIGDGKSDHEALGAKDMVAWYFALEDSEFADDLEKNGIPYSSYRNFDDIRLPLQQPKPRNIW